MYEDEWEKTASLKQLAYNAYGNEEVVPDVVWAAVHELENRGYREDEIYRFVTWGDN